MKNDINKEIRELIKNVNPRINIEETELIDVIEVYHERVKHFDEKIADESYFAIPILIELLTSNDVEVRINAIRFIRKIGGSLVREAIDPLIESLKDENPKVRGYAAYALGDIGYPDAEIAIKPLIEILKDPIDPLRYNYYNYDYYGGIDLYSQYQVQAARALKKIGIKFVLPYLHQLISVLKSTMQTKSFIPPLTWFEEGFFSLMLDNNRKEILRTIKVLLKDNLRNLSDVSIFSSLDQIDITGDDYSFWEIGPIYENPWREDEILEKNNLYDFEGISDADYRDSITNEDYKEWFDNQVINFQINQPSSMLKWLEGFHIQRTEVPRVYGHYMESHFEQVIPFLAEAAISESLLDAKQITYRKYAIWALGQCSFYNKKELLLKPLLKGLQDQSSEIQIEASCAMRKLGLTSYVSSSLITELCKELYSNDNKKKYIVLRVLGELQAAVKEEFLTIIESIIINDPLIVGRAGIGVLEANNWVASSTKLAVFCKIVKRNWADFKDIKTNELQWLEKSLKNFDFWIKRGIFSVISEISSKSFIIWKKIIIDEFRDGSVQIQEVIIHNLAKSKQKKLLQLLVTLLEERGSFKIGFQSISQICRNFGEKLNDFPDLVLQGLGNFYQDNYIEEWVESWKWKSLFDLFLFYEDNLDQKSFDILTILRKHFDFEEEKQSLIESKVELCEKIDPDYYENSPRLEESFLILQKQSHLNIDMFYSSITQILSCNTKFSEWEYSRMGEIIFNLEKSNRLKFLEVHDTLEENTKIKAVTLLMHFPPALLSEEANFLKEKLQKHRLETKEEDSYFENNVYYSIRFDKKIGPWLIEGLISSNTILKENAENTFYHETEEGKPRGPLIDTVFNLLMPWDPSTNNFKKKESADIDRDILRMIQYWITNPKDFLQECIRYLNNNYEKSSNFWPLINEIVDHPCYELLPWAMIEGEGEEYHHGKREFLKQFTEIDNLKLMQSLCSNFDIDLNLKNELEEFFRNKTDIVIDFGAFKGTETIFRKCKITFLFISCVPLTQKVTEYYDHGIGCIRGYFNVDQINIAKYDFILIIIPLRKAIKLNKLDASSSYVLKKLIKKPNSSLQACLGYMKELSDLPIFSNIDLIDNFLPGLKQYNAIESYWTTMNDLVSKEYFIIPYVMCVIGNSPGLIHRKISLLEKFSNVSSKTIIDSMLSTYTMHLSVQKTLSGFKNAKTLRLGLGLIINNRKEIISFMENSEISSLSASQNLVLFTLTGGSDECFFKPFLLHRKGFLTATNKFALIPNLDNPILVEFNNSSHDMLKKKIKDCDKDLQVTITLCLDYLDGLEEIT